MCKFLKKAGSAHIFERACPLYQDGALTLFLREMPAGGRYNGKENILGDMRSLNVVKFFIFRFMNR